LAKKKQWAMVREKIVKKGLFGRIYHYYFMCERHAFIDSSCLVKEIIRRVMTFEKTMLRVITLNFFFKIIHW